MSDSNKTPIDGNFYKRADAIISLAHGDKESQEKK